VHDLVAERLPREIAGLERLAGLSRLRGNAMPAFLISSSVIE
jgi:hypothetical protein